MCLFVIKKPVLFEMSIMSLSPLQQLRHAWNPGTAICLRRTLREGITVPLYLTTKTCEMLHGAIENVTLL